MRLILTLLSSILALSGGIVPAGKAFLEPLQKRDSLLIADQVEYGFVLDSVPAGASVGLPDFESVSSDTLFLVRNWKLDTLGRKSSRASFLRIRGSVVLSPFEAGEYRLPDIPVGLRTPDGKVDTLVFSALSMDVKSPQVDTATFEVRPLKEQIRYPVTFSEALPWLLGVLGLAALVVLAVVLVRRFSRRGEKPESSDPAHVVALRKLDRYRDTGFWAPENQKAFYSGVTDTLKEYIDARFGIDAPEMTTAELFEALKGCPDVPADSYKEMKSMFEEADFVKFAKMTLPDEENARVLPVAVRFVTGTYQAELGADTQKGGEA